MRTIDRLVMATFATSIALGCNALIDLEKGVRKSGAGGQSSSASSVSSSGSSVCGGASCSSCRDCARTGPCSMQYDQCQVDSECGALESCTEGCGEDQSCVLSCVQSHTSAIDAWEGLYICEWCEECSTACSSGSLCGGDAG